MPDPNSIYRIPFAKRCQIRLKRILQSWPVLLWILLVAFVIWGISDKRKTEVVPGLLMSSKSISSCVSDSQIESIKVTTGQQVKAGELLFTLLSDELELDLALQKAEASREERDSERQFLNAVQRVDMEIRERRAEHAEDMASLKYLREDLQRLKNLQASRLVDDDSTAKVEMQIAALQARTDTYENDRKELEYSRSEILRIKKSLDAERTASLNSLLAELERKQQALNIRAPHDGIVGEIFVTVGQSVGPETPLLEVLRQDQLQIHAFAPTTIHHRVAIGETVYIVRGDNPLKPITGTITSLSPSIASLEDRTNPIMMRKVYGRFFTVEPSEEIEGIDGEKLSIHFSKPKAKGVSEWIGGLLN